MQQTECTAICCFHRSVLPVCFRLHLRQVSASSPIETVSLSSLYLPLPLPLCMRTKPPCASKQTTAGGATVGLAGHVRKGRPRLSCLSLWYTSSPRRRWARVAAGTVMEGVRVISTVNWRVAASATPLDLPLLLRVSDVITTLQFLTQNPVSVYYLLLDCSQSISHIKKDGSTHINPPQRKPSMKKTQTNEKLHA